MSDSSRKAGKYKGRLVRIGLRTFFALLTVLCAWLAWNVYQVNTQRKAIQWVKETGGQFQYDYESDGAGKLLQNAEPPGPNWLRHRIGLDYFANVVTVRIVTKPVSDISPLAQLKNLKYLDLQVTLVNDVTPLAGLNNLERLWLHDTLVSDVTPLADLNRLQLLWLRHTPVSDITSLADLKNLRELWLDRTLVKDLTPLARLKHLDYLDLGETSICDVTPLTGLSSLERPVAQWDRSQRRKATGWTSETNVRVPQRHASQRRDSVGEFEESTVLGPSRHPGEQATGCETARRFAKL